MQKLHELDDLFNFFTLFGKTPELPQRIKKQSRYKVLIRRIIYIVFAIYSAYYAFIQTRLWSKTFGVSFTGIRMLILIFVFVFSLWLDAVHSNVLSVIFTNTGSIFNYIEREFEVTISMRSMIRSLHRKILATYTLQAVLVATSLFLDMLNHRSTLEIACTKTIFAYRDFVALYYVIFIDLFTLTLRSLNESIDRVTVRRETIAVKLETMHKAKWVYYNLWKTCSIYSRRFVSERQLIYPEY